MANQFLVGDKVKTAPGAAIARLNGKVKYIACQLATHAGGATCNRKTCTHPIKDNVWVLWVGKVATMSYHHSELEYEVGYKAPSPTTLPAAKDMPTAPTTEKEKDMASFKRKVSDIMQPTTSGRSTYDADWWSRYNGFTNSKFRRGHMIDAPDERKPLQESEIDFSAYNGFTKGPVRKSPG